MQGKRTVLQYTFILQIGEISDIRLIKNATGRSKGFAYVEFIDELAAGEALKLDRTPVDGRPMYVSRCEEKKPGGNPAKFKVGDRGAS